MVFVRAIGAKVRYREKRRGIVHRTRPQSAPGLGKEIEAGAILMIQLLVSQCRTEPLPAPLHLATASTVTA